MSFSEDCDEDEGIPYMFDDEDYHEVYEDDEDPDSGDNGDENRRDYIYRTKTVTLERLNDTGKSEYGLNMYSNFKGFSETPQRRAFVIIGSYEEMCEIRNALNKAIAEDSHKAKPPVKKIKKREFNRFSDIEVV